MIQIFIDNEELDLDDGQIVTIKKSQNLNGIQNQFSFSNNVNAPLTSKNQRLLKINYLPNSKAKSMTQGYDIDVVINGCMFFKKQKLKIQKENEKSISFFMIFADSFFLAKTKTVLVNDVDLGVTYDKSVLQFLQLNTSTTIIRTAPISAQSESNFIAIEEVPPLLNVVKLVEKIILGLGYSFYGNFFNDLKLKEYYLNPNSSKYGIGGVPKFDGKLNVFQFLMATLKTFNAYIDVSDSGKSVGVFLWNDIENLKKNFIDYSSYYEKYNDYAFEGGLSKINTIEYSGSQPFYNSFFENNKSIVEVSSYLKLDFGAGSLRLFSDQELTETFTLPLRLIGEQSETSEINIFKFEATTKQTVYYVAGGKFLSPMFRVFSPNILDVFNDFHEKYVKNISLPTVANLQFRYDAIFLANLKMQNVFFIKNLSTYWLPLEINYSTKKDKIVIKSLMIEKTAVDVPIVFDFNVSVGFLGKYIISNASPLYSTQNISPQSIFTIHSFDQSQNKIFITGNNNIRTQILSTPINIDIATSFILEFENINLLNEISNSDLLFSFTSQEGGVSRIARINIRHNGSAKYVSKFNTITNPSVFSTSATGNFLYYLNPCQKITRLDNVPNTLPVSVGVFYNGVSALNGFKVITLTKPLILEFNLKVSAIHYYGKGGGGIFTDTARLTIRYQIYKNNDLYFVIYSNAVFIPGNINLGTTSYNIDENLLLSGQAGDSFSLMIEILGSTSRSNINTQLNNTFNTMEWTIKAVEQL